jgi:hypothetical protein
MHLNGVDVLAVQETRIRQQTSLAAAAGLKYYGADASVTDCVVVPE